ncbi:MAG: P-loop NTPase [Candidatus Binataceae bacterium]|nr:P-loop NTPase [Candidatus Binataceae bacterium]
MRIFADSHNDADHRERLAESPQHRKIAITAPRAVIALASLRGGTGKSVLAVNLAAAMALNRRKSGILDADLNGPCVPAMLGVKPFRMVPMVGGIETAGAALGLRIMAANLMPSADEAPAISFLNDEPQAPAEHNGPQEVAYGRTLETLASQTRFGPVDLVIVDLAPGLEHLYRAARMIELNGIILIDRPSGAGPRAARGAAELAASAATPVLGVIENMIGFNCDSCHSVRPLFPMAGALGDRFETPVLGRLPFDPRMAESAERGTPFVREHADTTLARQITEIARHLETLLFPANPQREVVTAARS